MSGSALPISVRESADPAPHLAAEIVDQIHKASHLLRLVLAQHFAEFELSDARYAAMRIVRDSAPGGCSQTELAERLNQSVSSISTLVERMRNDGLLYRLRSKTDRRKRVLILTLEGRQLLDRADICHARRVDKLLAGLDTSRQRGLHSTLAVLVAELSRKRADDRQTPVRTSVPLWPDDQRRGA